ncbi:hypothetical protein SADUNF_Sadunf08G0087200 [Salix dunnii]|uniref:Endosulphine n=1 Tax=Salix dunnii TaxID=1413687 RepID=A0A835JXZ7_9ROSI|nr:hypothetical protein SADUNF_Sadunf08G0087200 [Salix dunnii]
MADCSRNEDFYGSQDIQGASMTKKYGGLEPKKKPLISKDHERAFFDSADWALCKQGAGVDQTSTVAIETLRPKLQGIEKDDCALLAKRREHLTIHSRPGDQLVHLVAMQIRWSEQCVFQSYLCMNIVYIAICLLIKESSCERN